MKRIIGWILFSFVIACALFVIGAVCYDRDGVAGLISCGIMIFLLGLFVLAIKLID